MTTGLAIWTLARDVVGRRLGLDFPDDRIPMLARGLAEAARAVGLRSPQALLASLVESPDDSDAWRELASRLTVKETYFFRDPACFESLEATVLPALLAARAGRARRLSLWSAGCATGEEAYSLAILIDRLLPSRSGWEIEIRGTDVDAGAIEEARRGRYREWSLRATPPPIRDRCFARRGAGRFEIQARIRRLVRFEADNLVHGPAAGPFDLILCRNTLMYLTPGAAIAATARLRESLAPDGWLAVAAAEASAERFHPLVPVNLPGAIYFRKARAVAVQPPAPAGPGAGSRSPRPPAVGPRSTPARARAPREARTSAPRDVDAVLASARAAADAGALDEAFSLCRAALATERLLAGAHCLVGQIHMERGEVEAAARALRRCLYLDADCAEAHAALGQVLIRRGDERRGLKHLETARLLAGGGEAS